MLENPLREFYENWQHAKLLGDANSNFCTFATVDDIAQVSLRTLVLRDITSQGVIVFVNNTSPKWRHIQEGGSSELLVFWPSLMQQYRVRGKIEEVSLSDMALSWSKKPYESKLLDIFYSQYIKQSGVIESRTELIKKMDKLKALYPSSDDLICPDNVKGLSIQINYLESWANSSQDQVYNRAVYRLSENGWSKQVLVP